jgi:hypothetical protein
MCIGIPDWERQRDSAREQVFARPVTRLLDGILDALGWFDQIATASLRAIGRTLVEGIAAYGLSMCGFDPDFSRHPHSPSETLRETEAPVPESQHDTRDESVDDLIRSIRLNVRNDMQDHG